MKAFKLSEKLNKNKVFIINKNKLERRLDPLFYASDIFGFIKETKFNVKTVKEVSRYAIAGFGAGREDQDLTEKGYIQIRPTNIGEFGRLKFDKNIYLDSKYLLKKKENIIQKDDVLFNNTNSQELVGKTSYFDLDGTFFHSNHITRIGVKKDLILPKFLWHLLNFYQQRKVFYSICTNWNNQSGVGLELLNSLKIPVPPRAIQEKIVQIMDNTYWQKKQNEAEAEKLLASIDDYLMAELGIKPPVQSENSLNNRIFLTSLNEVSGHRFDPFFYQKYFDTFKNPQSKYPIKKIKEVSDSIKTGLPVRKDFRAESGKYPYYGANGIIGYMDEYTHNGLYLVIGQDGYIGNHFVVKGKFWGSNHNWVMKLKDGYDYNFIKAALDLFKYEYLVTGGVIPKLTKEALETICIAIPPLPKQTEIANHISKTRQKAQSLKDQTTIALEKANKEIENILLGNNS